MFLRSISLIIAAYLALGSIQAAIAADTDLPDGTALDPLDAHAGDFLDTDLWPYMQAAAEAYRAGDYLAAAESYFTLVSYNITDAASIYALACCYGRLGEPELAVLYMKRAAHAGYDVVTEVPGSPDFASVSEIAAFRDAFSELMSEAEQAALEKRLLVAVLGYDPREPESAIELARCYALRGEAEKGVEYLNKAREAGFAELPAVLAGPDFDQVRDDDAFIVFTAAANGGATAATDGPQTTPPDTLPAAAQPELDLGEQMLFTGEVCLPYRIKLPDDFDPQQTYPLVIGLHGYSSAPEVFITSYSVHDDPEFIFAVPQAPYPVPLGMQMGYSWISFSEEFPELTEESIRLAEGYILEVIAQIRMDYPISDVHLLGFSQGAIMAFSVGLKHPTKFAGIACLSGWLDDEWLGEDVIAAASGLPVFMALGTGDNPELLSAAIRSKHLLIEQGYDLAYREFEGGHTMPADILREVTAWMFGD